MHKKYKLKSSFITPSLFHAALYIGIYLRCLGSLMNNELYCFDDQIFVQFHRRNEYILMNNYFGLFWYRLNLYIEFQLHSLLRFCPMLNAFFVLHIERKPFFLSACEFWESLNTMSAYLSRVEFPCTHNRLFITFQWYH